MQLKVYEIAWGETVTSTGAIAGDVVTYNITFSDQGVQGPVGPSGPQGIQGLPGDFVVNFRVVSAAETLVSKAKIAANTTGAAFTLTLPANPTNGDVIDFYDYAETFDTNNLTIARNGRKIEGLEENLVCNVKGAYFSLVYSGSTRGWQVLPSFGTSGGGGETVLTTQGDTLYRGLGVNQRLPIGSPGHILKVNSGGTAPEWGAAPATGVTSVALSSSDLTVSGSPVTSSGTITANLINSGVSAGTYSKVTVDAKGRVTTGATAGIADVTGLQSALDAKQPSGSYAAAVHTHAISDVTGLQTALDGKQASGNYATLVSGKVPSDQLPSFVDDVVEYANLAAFPVTGESGKIYVAIDTRKTYRWSGSAYIEISPSEVTSVAGRTGAVTLAVADVTDAVPTSRTISAGTGLTGGGDLTANRTLTVAYGTTSGTACQGNDARLSDSRTPTAHAASHLGGVKAYFTGQVGGMTENVFIRANNAGTAGNSIVLAFDGVDDINTVLAAWNSANPSNQATLVSGDGAQIPDSGQEIAISSGVASGSDPITSANLSSLLVSGSDAQNPDIVFKGRAFLGNASGSTGFITDSNAEFHPAETIGFTGVNATVTEYRPIGFTTGYFAQLFLDTSGDIGVGTSSPEAKLDVNGNAVLRDVTNSFKATFDADDKLSANRTYDLPDASGTLALTSDIPANTIASTIVDAKGDLIVGTAADTVARLPVGATNGHVLTVDSAEASGMKWAAASGGVTSVTGTAPIVSSGGTTPAISVTVGTTANTVAAGDDSRITGAAQKSANLSDLASASTARTNLGLGTAATAATGDFAAASHNHAASAITSGVFDNARINFAAPSAIGSTTPSTGAFTTLNANNGTLTASAPVLDLSQTWNNAAVTFTGLRFNVTNTASAVASLIADFQVGGNSFFQFRRDGQFLGPTGAMVVGTNGGGRIEMWGSGFGAQPVVFRSGNATYRFALDTSSSGSNGVFAVAEANNTFSLLNGVNSQTFRLYNTYTDASNYERAKIAWSSNVLQIGTEKAGTGSARALEFQTDGTTRASVTTGGNFWVNNQLILGTTVLARITSPADGVVTLFDSGQATFNRIQFGGTTSSFPALKRSSTALQVRLADDSAFAPLSCGALTLNGNLDASTRDIVTDTTTGTKIGTGTTQKIGFFNATPVVQQAAVADATDAASTQARLNDLLARLRTLGLIAT